MRGAVFAVLVAVAAAVSPTPISLPGVPGTPAFDSYAGFVPVDEEAGRSLFYVFSESQRDAANDPVVLWLTGGPGCSSLIAFLGENGPYRPDPSDPTKLVEDDYSWNKVANVIWLESPRDVGFSFSKTPGDAINVTDAQSAGDVYRFLQTFFTDLFPQFQSNPFYVTGESYGGHYVPSTSLLIVEGNAANTGTHINIQGFLEGNAWTFMPYDNMGAIDTWWQRGIVPREKVDAIKQHCNLSYVGPLLAEERQRDSMCNSVISDAMSAFQYVDIYDIYVDVCESSNAAANIKLKFLKQMAKVSWFHRKILDAVSMRAEHLRPKETKSSKKRGNPPLPPFDPCNDNHLTDYLNQLDVQKAMNAVPPSATKPVTWNECSNTLQYSFDSVAANMIPTLERLFDNKDFHALVYSGDVDAIVPFDGTMNWIRSLNRSVVSPWRVWLDENNQAGGFVTVYDGFTFTTVRNAGHQVPEYQPARAFQMFASWLANHTIQ